MTTALLDRWPFSNIQTGPPNRGTPLSETRNHRQLEEAQEPKLQPIFPQLYESTDAPATNPAAAASVFPWPLQNLLDPVRYQIASGAMFISIEHPHIFGAGCNSEFRNRPRNTSMYRCIASPHGYSFCPKIGERSMIASAQVDIDEKSDGVLMVIATTVPTADHNDMGGTVSLGLRIDGVDVGSVGMQELPLASVESAQTLTANYLADNEHKLARGKHLVESWMYAEEGSSLKWISVPKELSILFFH